MSKSAALILFCVCVGVHPLYAADSATSDTTQVLLLAAQAEQYLTSEPARAKKLAEEGLTLTRKIHYQRGELILLNHLSDYYYRQSNYVSAIACGMQSLKIAQQLGDSLAMANVYRNIGNTNTFGLKQYDQAITYHELALRIYRLKRDSLHIAAEDGSITWIYAITHQNLKDAMMMADQGIVIARKLGNSQIMSYNYNSEGLIYLAQGQYDSARANITRSIDLAQKANDQAVIAYNNSILGDINRKEKKFLQAIDFYQQSIAQSEKLNIREISKESYGGLAGCYAALHQFDKAYSYQNLYTQLRDSLLNWETTQKTLLIQRQFEAQYKTDIIEQLEREKKIILWEKNMYIILFTVGFTGLLVIVLLIARNNYQKRTANHQLQQKNEEIETQNEELLQSKEEIASQRDIVAEQNQSLQRVNETKDKLFSIISHDLRGPIASLKGLLGLLAAEHISAEELKQLMPKINQNVGTLHQMMENLLRWSNTQMSGFRNIPVQIDLSELLKEETSLVQDIAAVKRIQISSSIAERTTAFADKDHVRIIVRNLLNNAIKFTQEEGVVVVGTEPDGEFVVLSFTDNGVGISTERIDALLQGHSHFSSPGTRGERGTGLGLLLCKEMAEANGGRISLQSEVGKGSTFFVYLRK